ncbi:MAG: MarR family transcriptional regulator [Candidatus Omnitrophota bacterium]
MYNSACMTPEERLRRIAELVNKGVYLLGLKEGWFVHKIKKQKQKEIQELSFEESQIIDLCKRKGVLANKEIRSLLGIHRNTATNKLKQLVAKGLLTRSGNKRYAYYTLSIGRQ